MQIPFIPKEIPSVPNRLDALPIAYKVTWTEKDIKKNINYSELDECEIAEIKEFELDIIKGASHISDLLNIVQTVTLYENLAKSKKSQNLTIYSYYIDGDKLITKRQENFWELKAQLNSK